MSSNKHEDLQPSPGRQSRPQVAEDLSEEEPGEGEGGGGGEGQGEEGPGGGGEEGQAGGD